MDLDTTSTSDTSDFKLGEWWIRPQRNELERASEIVHVEARSMAVLVCLARHAPGVATKEQVLEDVWSDSPYVGDDVISHAIWELRKALGDSARDSVYIQTVPRKGYRLVAEILRPQGSPLPIAGVRIDHYDLGEELGRGAMGVVYEATDRRLGRAVAIKFLAPELTRDPKACQRFEREARLAASLEHPNLGTVHEVGETSRGHRYLVSAYYRGGSLKDRLADGPMDVNEALRRVRQLLAGLGAAHKQAIVHRDIKPANLLLDEHGTLKICDFGIAKLLGATDLTRTGAALGTPAYKSPEQAQGRPVDHRTDLWAVGVVLFEMLTGRRPFDGEYEQAVVQSILSREPRGLEEAGGRPVPESLRHFVTRALAKEPADRFQSAEEMTAALDGLEDGSGLPPSSMLRQAGRSRRWLALAAGALVFLVSMGGLVWQRVASPPPVVSQPRVATEVESNATGRDHRESREGEQHLAQGRIQWLRGDYPSNWGQVGDHFTQAVELLPSSSEAKAHLAAFLAESYAAQKQDTDRNRARELIREGLVLNPLSALAKAAEAWILHMEEKTDEAEALLREAIKIQPTCGETELCDLAYVWLAEVLWSQRVVNEAYETLNQGIQAGGGGFIRCRLKRALFLSKSGFKGEAEAEYRSVLDFDREQTTALHELAQLYITTQRTDEAVELLQRLRSVTGDPRVLTTIGYVLYDAKRWSEAIRIYIEAHEAFEEAGVRVPTPLTAIGDIYLEQGKESEAKRQYRRALAIFEALQAPPLFRQAQHAVCLAKVDLVDQAEEKIQSLLEFEDEPNMLFYAGRIYALKGDRTTLFALARRSIERGGDPQRFLDDPAFIPYRTDPDYLDILGI